MLDAIIFKMKEHIKVCTFLSYRKFMFIYCLNISDSLNIHVCIICEKEGVCNTSVRISTNVFTCYQEAQLQDHSSSILFLGQSIKWVKGTSKESNFFAHSPAWSISLSASSSRPSSSRTTAMA